MRITIYQMKSESNHEYLMFRDLQSILAACNNRVPAEHYESVYDGELDIKSLEDAYYIFNMAHPKGYRGRSMSISDVVEVHDPDVGSVFYYCDTIGFKRILFDKDKAGAGKTSK